MKRIFYLFLFSLLTFSVAAQKMSVDSFVQTASLDGKKYSRMDANGDACALIKVRLAREGATFEGNVVGDVLYEQSEYWVYMYTGSTKKLTVKVSGALPLDVYFPDYAIDRLLPNTTYNLVIALPNAGGQEVDLGAAYFILHVQPQAADATVLIDGKKQERKSDGTFRDLLFPGQHSYTVSASGYESETRTFQMGREKKTETVNLTSALCTLQISCATSDAKIYINEEQKGTGNWSGSLSPGNYIVEARKEGFSSQKKLISLKAQETQICQIEALVSMQGGLDVDFSPADAEIWIDGIRRGSSPDKLRVDVGQHSVEIRMAGYKTYKQNVSISEGNTSMLKGHLEKELRETATESSRSLFDKGEELYKKKDFIEAEKWFRKAAEQGLDIAQYYLGYIFKNGLGVSQDDMEAVKWYKKSAEQGFSVAQNALGECYKNGMGVSQNPTEAVKWYRKSAEQGLNIAQYSLGSCYEKGIGVTKDYAEAVKWYRKSAEQGFSFAQYILGSCYKNGKGVSQDFTEAAKWYRKAAEQGVSIAQYNLGFCYEKGEGVSQDPIEAVKWYRKSAEQGFNIAQYELGYCYKNGIGVPQDPIEAVKWYRKSAEQGFDIAQFTLGYCYEKGQGVSQDSAEAVKWYKKAASQGNANAQKRLREMGITE